MNYFISISILMLVGCSSGFKGGNCPLFFVPLFLWMVSINIKG